MIIEKVNDSARVKLRMSLEKFTNSIARRNVTFIINGHTGTTASITLIVTGKRGTAQKNIVIVYNELEDEWLASSDGYEYKMLSLGELSTLLKTKVQKLSTLLSKL